jgi:hypothetical protein
MENALQKYKFGCWWRQTKAASKISSKRALVWQRKRRKAGRFNSCWGVVINCTWGLSTWDEKADVRISGSKLNNRFDYVCSLIYAITEEQIWGRPWNFFRFRVWLTYKNFHLKIGPTTYFWGPSTKWICGVVVQKSLRISRQWTQINKPSELVQRPLNIRAVQVPLPWNWPEWKKYEEKLKVKYKLEFGRKMELHELPQERIYTKKKRQSGLSHKENWSQIWGS